MVALTLPERRILDEAKGHYEELFGVRLSWGLFLVSLALGVLSVRDIAGFSIACPYCSHVIEAKLQRPKSKQLRRPLQVSS